MIISWAFETAFNTPRVVVFIFPGSAMCPHFYAHIFEHAIILKEYSFLVLHGNRYMVAVGHMNLLLLKFLLLA